MRDEDQVNQRIDEAVEHISGIDALMNKAGAIRLAGVEKMKVSRFDLLHQVNVLAVMACSQAAFPWLKQSERGHILSMSPSLNMDPKWFAHFGPYTSTKYSMTMISIDMAQEFKRSGIACEYPMALKLSLRQPRFSTKLVANS